MAISLVGQKWVPPADNDSAPLGSATPIVIAPPGSMLTGDLVLVFVVVRNNTAITVSAAGGQTWQSQTQAANGTTIGARLFSCYYNGTWSTSPSFAVGSTTDGVCAHMCVLRGVHGTTRFDVNPTEVDYTAVTAKTLAAIVTATNGAWAFHYWGEPDDNALSGQDTGWTGPDGSAGALHDHVGNMGGSDDGLFVSVKVQATAGSTGTNVVALGTGDLGTGYDFAVKPGAGSYAATGTAVCGSGATAAVTAKRVTSGTAAAVSAATGDIYMRRAATGSIAGVSTVTCDAVRQINVTGTVAALSGLTGSVYKRSAASGTVAVTSTTICDVTRRTPVTGTVAAACAATGSVFKTLAASGTVSAQTGAVGDVTRKTSVTGTVAATSVVTCDATITSTGGQYSVTGTVAAVSTVTCTAAGGAGLLTWLTNGSAALCWSQHDKATPEWTKDISADTEWTEPRCLLRAASTRPH